MFNNKDDNLAIYDNTTEAGLGTPVYNSTYDIEEMSLPNAYEETVDDGLKQFRPTQQTAATSTLMSTDGYCEIAGHEMLQDNGFTAHDEHHGQEHPYLSANGDADDYDNAEVVPCNRRNNRDQPSLYDNNLNETSTREFGTPKDTGNEYDCTGVNEYTAITESTYNVLADNSDIENEYNVSGLAKTSVLLKDVTYDTLG